MERSNCLFNQTCKLKDDVCVTCIKPISFTNLLTNSEIPITSPIKLEQGSESENSWKSITNIYTNINEFVSEGNNLMIKSSNTGNGKTSWAMKIGHRYIEKNWDKFHKNKCLVKFVKFGEFILGTKMMFHDDDIMNRVIKLEKEMKACELLILDDFAECEVSENSKLMLTSILDSRTFNKKTTIYTTNILDGEIMSRLVGPRIMSRACKTSHQITFRGNDRREE